MPTPDNRIRYPASRIDFATDVGLTGQTHDDYPGANQQARYDWMRITLIGLLSSQSSNDAPTQYREGTPWFNLTDATLRIRKQGNWENFSKAIKLADTDTTPITLQDWYDSVSSNLSSLVTETFFHGNVVTTGATLIPIPLSLQSQLLSTSRPFVYVNGELINPATVTLEPNSAPTAVKVPAGSLTAGDELSILIKSIPNSRFLTSPVVV